MHLPKVNEMFLPGKLADRLRCRNGQCFSKEFLVHWRVHVPEAGKNCKSEQRSRAIKKTICPKRLHSMQGSRGASSILCKLYSLICPMKPSKYAKLVCCQGAHGQIHQRFPRLLLPNIAPRLKIHAAILTVSALGKFEGLF